MRLTFLLRFALACATPALVACASVQRGDDGRVHVLQPDFLAQVPSTSQYGGAVDTPVADAAKVAELTQRFEAGLPEAMRGRLVHDARLDHLARVHAVAYLEVTQRLSNDLQSRLAWRLGVPSPIAGSRSRWASGSDRFSSVGEFVDDMRERLPATGRFRYGIGRALGGKRVAVAMVWTRDVVALEPLPKTVEPGATVALRGRFTDTVKKPVLRLLENDVVRELPVEVSADQSFSVDVPLGAEAGTRWIDLHGSVLNEDESQRSYLWVPLFVGAAEPAVPPVEALGATTPTLDNVEALLVDAKMPLPERVAVLDEVAATIANQPESKTTMTPNVCASNWWWRRLGHDTLEEMRWSVQRLPSVVYQLRTEQRPKAGIAVVPYEKGTRTVIVECEPAAPSASGVTGETPAPPASN